jgi:hypothetical protein
VPERPVGLRSRSAIDPNFAEKKIWKKYQTKTPNNCGFLLFGFAFHKALGIFKPNKNFGRGIDEYNTLEGQKLNAEVKFSLHQKSPE